MKTKTILILTLFALLVGGCGQGNTKKQTSESGQQPQPDTVLSENGGDSVQSVRSVDTNVADTVKIVIDRSYLEKEGEEIDYYDGSGYFKYQIESLNTLELTDEDRFVWDETKITFSIIDEIKLYDNIRSLIIRGEAEHATGMWLVNYDMNGKDDPDYYTYIDSCPIGYDKPDETDLWGEVTKGATRTSVIYMLPKLYMEQEYVTGEEKESSRIEIHESGKFNVTQTVRSKHE